MKHRRIGSIRVEGFKNVLQKEEEEEQQQGESMSERCNTHIHKVLTYKLKQRRNSLSLNEPKQIMNVSIDNILDYPLLEEEMLH